jgi:tetratricopeptide (TPR) repeat protein
VILALAMQGTTRLSSLDTFQKALVKEKAEGDLEGAIALYQKVVEKGEDEALAAQAQLHVGMCYEKLGLGKAREAYEKVIERFPKQEESVRTAREKLARLETPAAAKDDGLFKIRLVLSYRAMFGMILPTAGRSPSWTLNQWASVVISKPDRSDDWPRKPGGCSLSGGGHPMGRRSPIRCSIKTTAGTSA